MFKLFTPHASKYARPDVYYDKTSGKFYQKDKTGKIMDAPINPVVAAHREEKKGS